MTVLDGQEESLRLAMADLTSDFGEIGALERTLANVTATAVDLVDGVDYADVTLIDEGRPRSVCPTVPLLVELNAVQIRLNEGPRLMAAVGGAMIRCTDLREDSRWPGYSAAAVSAGVYSLLSFQLMTHNNVFGALNLFGTTPREVDPAAEAIGALLATLATVALRTADKQEQFETALTSRDVIGQAKGILMNHFKIDAAQAFAMLKTLSQNGNTPVRTIAEQIIATI